MLYFVFVRNIFTIYKEVERCTEHMTNIVLADVADMITNIIITIMTVDVDMTTDTNTIIMKAVTADAANMSSRMKM